MSYQGQYKEESQADTAWRPIASSSQTTSQWNAQPSLLDLLDRLQRRSVTKKNYRYRVVSTETGAVLCQQNQDRTWPELQPVPAVVGRRFRGC